jgi:hypothetical protein
MPAVMVSENSLQHGPYLPIDILIEREASTNKTVLTAEDRAAVYAAVFAHEDLLEDEEDEDKPSLFAT